MRDPYSDLNTFRDMMQRAGMKFEETTVGKQIAIVPSKRAYSESGAPIHVSIVFDVRTHALLNITASDES